MFDYRYSSNRKRHQRKLNKVMRLINKNIAEDNLWKGRFVVRQLNGSLIQYEDKSGFYYWVEVIFIDKKTGQYKVDWEDANYLMEGRDGLFWKINEFITMDCKVWEKDDPRLDDTNYNKFDVKVTGRFPSTYNIEPKIKVKIFRKG